MLVMIIITIFKAAKKRRKENYVRNIPGKSKIVKSRNINKNNRTTLSAI
jgi:hypothetical protein